MMKGNNKKHTRIDFDTEKHGEVIQELKVFFNVNTNKAAAEKSVDFAYNKLIK